MREYDQRTCPRCGAAAGDYHFCPSCLAPVDSPAPVEQTLVATAEGEAALASRELSATAVKDEDTTPDTSTASSDVAMRPDSSVSPPNVARLEDVLKVDRRSADGLAAGETTAPAEASLFYVPRSVSVPPPNVARLEDVLIVAPSEEGQEIAPKTAAAAAAPKVEPVATDADEAPPVEEVDRSATSIPPPTPAPAPSLPPAASAPNYVAAHALRAAFLFELSSAFKSDDEDEEPVSQAPPVVVSEVAAPVASPVVGMEPEPAEAGASHTNWLAALCLLALIALVVMLTGRRPCRCNCK